MKKQRKYFYLNYTRREFDTCTALSKEDALEYIKFVYPFACISHIKIKV